MVAPPASLPFPTAIIDDASGPICESSPCDGGRVARENGRCERHRIDDIALVDHVVCGGQIRLRRRRRDDRLASPCATSCSACGSSTTENGSSTSSNTSCTIATSGAMTLNPASALQPVAKRQQEVGGEPGARGGLASFLIDHRQRGADALEVVQDSNKSPRGQRRRHDIMRSLQDTAPGFRQRQER